MSCPIAAAHALAARAIAVVCTIEANYSPAIAKATHHLLTWLLTVVLPA